LIERNIRINSKGEFMDLFKMAKEAMSMRSKMGELDKKMRGISLETEYKGIKIISNAKTEFISVEIPQDILTGNKEEAQKHILAAFNNASHKAQEKMAEISKEMLGDMNIPGLK
jgi:DNA-binding protein YbaB